MGGRLGLEAGNLDPHAVKLEAALAYVMKGTSSEAASQFGLERLEPGECHSRMMDGGDTLQSAGVRATARRLLRRFIDKPLVAQGPFLRRDPATWQRGPVIGP